MANGVAAGVFERESATCPVEWLSCAETPETDNTKAKTRKAENKHLKRRGASAEQKNINHPICGGKKTAIVYLGKKIVTARRPRKSRLNHSDGKRMVFVDPA